MVLVGRECSGFSVSALTVEVWVGFLGKYLAGYLGQVNSHLYSFHYLFQSTALVFPSYLSIRQFIGEMLDFGVAPWGAVEACWVDGLILEDDNSCFDSTDVYIKGVTRLPISGSVMCTIISIILSSEQIWTQNGCGLLDLFIYLLPVYYDIV